MTQAILKNGISVKESEIEFTSYLLSYHHRTTPENFAQFVEKCNDPSVVLSVETIQKLKNSYIMNWDGSIPTHVAAIVQNAVTLEGGYKFSDPRKVDYKSIPNPAPIKTFSRTTSCTAIALVVCTLIGVGLGCIQGEINP